MKVASVSYKEVIEGLKILKPNFHLNYGKSRVSAAKKKGIIFSPLSSIVDEVFTGGIFKRVFVDNLERGLPYISAQHMMNSNAIEVAKIISKKYTPRQEDMTLKENVILVSCAGTVGNIRLITKDLVGAIGSQDIIRVIGNNKKSPIGFVYAYLSSPTAFNYIQSYIYGSVVPRIEPNTLSKLPIPAFSTAKQNKIHDLIMESSALRSDSNALLKKAHKIIEKPHLMKNLKDTKIGIVNSKRVSNNLRFGGFFFLSAGDTVEKRIQKENHQPLAEIASEIFTGGRDKRNYTTKDKGLAFLSNGDISCFNPFNSCNYIVKKSVKENSYITEDMVLTGRVGQDTVGKVYLPLPSTIGCVASDNIIRIRIPDEKKRLLCFAFLSSEIGNKVIKKRESGVGQPFITEEMLYNIPIPTLSNSEINKVVELIKQYREKADLSLKYELKAIDIVEKEIESWLK